MLAIEEPLCTIQRWYLIRTKSGDEEVARTHLLEQGYGSYFPQVMRRRRVRGKRVRQIDPLFPRYVFLQLLIGQQDLTAVKSTRGVLNIVRFGDEYATVPDRVVEALRDRAHPTTGMHLVAAPLVANITPVRIIDFQSPFGGLEGLFVRECGEDRVLVLLNLIGQETRVEISEDLVEPLAR